MKIGILTSIGGTINAFFPPLIKRWEELGHEVATAASGPAESPHHTELQSLSQRPSPANVKAPQEIKAWVENEQLDVVITNTATASFASRLRQLGVPVIYFCHGLHWNQGDDFSSRVWQTLERFALRNTDGVIVINEDDEQWFSDKIAADKVHRLTMGVGLPIDDFPRSPIPPVEDRIELVWAGEFSERKRPELAVEVIHALSAQGVDVHLNMCGDGDLFAKTEQMIHQRGVADSITLVGRSSRVAEFLTNSHGMLLTSTWEGLPRIGLEAIAIGRPVFAFDVKGTRSLPVVYSVPEGDAAGLATLIKRTVEDGFSGVDAVDPAELHSDLAAEGIAGFAEQCVGNSRV